jgi:hypothetical protein
MSDQADVYSSVPGRTWTAPCAVMSAPAFPLTVQWYSPFDRSVAGLNRLAAVVDNASSAGIDGVAERWPDVWRYAVAWSHGKVAGSAVLERLRVDGFWAPEFTAAASVSHLGMVATGEMFRRRGVASTVVDQACILAERERFALCACTKFGSPASELFESWVSRGVRQGQSGAVWDCFLFVPDSAAAPH